MPTANEKLTKQAHDAKRSRAKKPTRFRPQASPTTNGTGFSSAVINLDHEAPGSDLVPRKRYPPGEGGLWRSLRYESRAVFMMPPYFTEDDCFDRFPLIVPLEAAQKIEEMDPNVQMKQLADDGASMVRVLEMAWVLPKGRTVSTTLLKKVEADKKAVERGSSAP